MQDRLASTAMTDAQKTEHIKAVVLQAGVELRQRHPFLLRQNLIGALILAGSLLGMVAAGTLYYYGLIAWYVCVPVAAIFASFTHELEHDLIHLMYFRNKPWAHNLMLALVWLPRPSTISPWTRRRMHLHHHKHAGTRTDLEEHGITNGYPLGRGIRQSELAGATPYNTYVLAGLPPTPICNPGKDAIIAVLNPEGSDDLYFVATGHGGHVFTQSLADHQKNVAKLRQLEHAH